MKRFLLPAALIVACMCNAFATNKNAGTKNKAAAVSSKFSSVFKLVPSNVAVGKSTVKFKTDLTNDQPDNYDVYMSGKNFKGQVTYADNGTLLNYNEEITDTKIPFSVASAIKARYPDAMFTKDKEFVQNGATEYKVYFICDKKHGHALVDKNDNIIKSK